MQEGLVERFRLLREALEGIDSHSCDATPESGNNVVGAAESDVETVVHVDLYALLGLPRCTSVSTDNIRTAFRTVSRLFHPDRHPTDTPADAEDRRKQFLDVSDAKAILTCTILRPIYDLGGMPAVVIYRAAATPMEVDVFPMDPSLKTMSYEEEIQGNRGMIVYVGSFKSSPHPEHTVKHLWHLD